MDAWKICAPPPASCADTMSAAKVQMMVVPG